MNAGFGSLGYLKTQLLPGSMNVVDQFDSKLLLLGLGVAATFDSECNRQFARQEGAQEEFCADYANFILSRAPVERLIAIELKFNEADGWEAQPDLSMVQSLARASGVVSLDQGLLDPGDYPARIRFTYDGGYWWDDSEDGEVSVPSSAAMLPEALRLAWVTQCREIWQQMDRIGSEMAASPSGQSALASVDLLPSVKRMISPYKRIVLV